MNHKVKQARRGLIYVFLLASLLVLLGAAPAMGAETFDTNLSFEQLFSRIQSTPVYKDACTLTCHANIAKTKNYDNKIIFSHGYHQLVDCASCHPRFPHRTDAKIDRPNMKKCFECHGVNHGPMGLIATAQCEKCHVEPKYTLRPSFHTYDWAKKPHVIPSEKEFNTKCAMCHTQKSCDDCHRSYNITWAPKNNNWEYDSNGGCNACHGNVGLTKASADGRKSFGVSGLDSSAHQDITCQQCHSDYNYSGAPAPTENWRVNVSKACENCHAKEKDPRLSEPVAKYKDSIHSQRIDEGNFDSATCGSCHGGHFIYKTDNPAGKARMHQSAYRTCARCKQHGADYTAYSDAYHGNAYKEGASDAPACWQCHGSHTIWPSKDNKSSLSTTKIGATCGQKGCHVGSDDKFGASAGQLIHQSGAARASNPVVQWWNNLTKKN